jgi:hypothetical protein
MTPTLRAEARPIDEPMDFVDYLFHCGGEDIIQLRTAADARTLVRKLRAKYADRDDIELDIDLDALTVKLALYLSK